MDAEHSSGNGREKWSKQIEGVLNTVQSEVREEVARNADLSPKIKANILTAIDITPKYAAALFLDHSMRYDALTDENKIRHLFNIRIRAAIADVVPKNDNHEEMLALNTFFQKLIPRLKIKKST